ncbi:hypothetical protein [Paenibacillus sp. 1001270B_150601_E10]|uniref:hypothetical protein n=1 Tax=Paenibacillus sp. 1001270B_150601_E10 TaxID=2787079 RepID=UPI0018A0F6A8|nr:hypothetical protein [Paenibacillus sp. 1001270B_150601_E10]
MKKRMIQGAVLSALLLTSVAAPAYASPQEGVTAKETIKTELVTSEAKTASFYPLELAKKYAPETVKDWEEVLKNMNITVAFTVEPSSSSEKGEHQKLEMKVISEEDIDWSKVKDAAEGKGQTKGMIAITKIAEAVPTEASDKKEAALVKVVDSEINDPQAKAFMETYKELNAAVDSKDTDAIKTSLAKLLKLYQEQGLPTLDTK